MSTVFVYTRLNVKTVLFQIIQFSISTQFGSLVVLFYNLSTLFRLFNAELSHFDKRFQQFSLV